MMRGFRVSIFVASLFFVVKERVVHAPVLNHRILPTFYINTTNIYIVLRSMVIPYSISNCAAYS